MRACWGRLELLCLRTLLDEAVDETVRQGFAQPPVKQLIAMVAQTRCGAPTSSCTYCSKVKITTLLLA